YDISDLARTDDERQELIESLQTATSAPWRQKRDGHGGTLTDFAAGLFVIRQSESAHADIAMMLYDLRQANRAAATEPPPPRPDAVETRFVRAKSKDEAKALERLILTFVAPGSWDVDGGAGLLRTAEDRLIIRQTKAVFEQIDKFLNDYQQAKPLGQVAPKTEKKP
ncbi:MAG TPA: hypothetical protein VK137_14285, partial [Planctomycetaceae bacterium]|nr:hypothetical protein [Planctomycetaceae bacterium]